MRFPLPLCLYVYWGHHWQNKGKVHSNTIFLGGIRNLYFALDSISLLKMLPSLSYANRCVELWASGEPVHQQIPLFCEVRGAGRLDFFTYHLPLWCRVGNFWLNLFSLTRTQYLFGKKNIFVYQSKDQFHLLKTVMHGRELYSHIHLTHLWVEQ